MNLAKTLAQLRKEKGYTQTYVADYLSVRSSKRCTYKNISHWETGISLPQIEQFLLLCELYNVWDIQGIFRGRLKEFHGMEKLNALGKSRAQEYIAMLGTNSLFAESETYLVKNLPASKRNIKLFDVPVAAGSGTFLDSDAYEELEVDETIPQGTDFAVRVSGDSMIPRFVDRQIVFIKEQQTLETGDIGIFSLDGDAYIKKLGQGELISLNKRYKPIKIHDYNSLRVFGRVVG